MFGNDNIIRRGHILNALLNPLFDVYQNYPTARELWKALKERFFTKDATRRLNMHTYSPSKEHWDAVNRVFKYLTKTMDYGLEYSRDPSVLEGYTDASWITDQEDYNAVRDRIMDSGASFHATYCKKELDRFRLRSGKVRLADDKTLDIAGVGNVVLKASFGTSWTLKDV
nr:retrovirus-related Pol polyprotein from transposon TNT 1-94 [Tanacetum cinerariifolium]